MLSEWRLLAALVYVAFLVVRFIAHKRSQRAGLIKDEKPRPAAVMVPVRDKHAERLARVLRRNYGLSDQQIADAVRSVRTTVIQDA